MVNLYRDLHVLEHIENHTLSLLHGVSQAWRAHPGGVAVAEAPTRFGCRVSVSHTPHGSTRAGPRPGTTGAAPAARGHVLQDTGRTAHGHVELSLRCPADMPAGDTPAVVRVHVGRPVTAADNAGTVLGARAADGAAPWWKSHAGLTVEHSGEGGGAVLVFHRPPRLTAITAWAGARIRVDLFR